MRGSDTVMEPVIQVDTGGRMKRNQKQIDDFTWYIEQSQEIVDRIKQLLDNDLTIDPERVWKPERATWARVGAARKVHEYLKQASDQIFSELKNVP